MRVPPPDTTVQCYIVRKKGAMGMFASYKLYLQENVSAGPGHMVHSPLIIYVSLVRSSNVFTSPRN